MLMLVWFSFRLSMLVSRLVSRVLMLLSIGCSVVRIGFSRVYSSLL